jgi:hypothetical protein
VFSSLELLDLRFVTISAAIGGWDLNLVDISSRFVLIAMARRTINFFLTVLAQLPVGDDLWGDLLVAGNAWLRQSAGTETDDGEINADRSEHHVSPPVTSSERLRVIVMDFIFSSTTFINVASYGAPEETGKLHRG